MLDIMRHEDKIFETKLVVYKIIARENDVSFLLVLAFKATSTHLLRICIYLQKRSRGSLFKERYVRVPNDDKKEPDIIHLLFSSSITFFVERTK